VALDYDVEMFILIPTVRESDMKSEHSRQGKSQSSSSALFVPYHHHGQTIRTAILSFYTMTSSYQFQAPNINRLAGRGLPLRVLFLDLVLAFLFRLPCFCVFHSLAGFERVLTFLS